MVVAAGVGALALLGCADAPSQSATGAIALQLSTDVNGAQYRLLDAVFDVAGPTPATLTTEEDPDATFLQVELLPGEYSVTLEDDWRLERGIEDEFQTVEAELLSDNPASVVIQTAVVTHTTFRFATDGELVAPPPNLADVLGFEDAELWSTTAALSLSDLRVQALHSLAVPGGGDRLISSAALSTFEVSSNEVSVAIRLPPEQPNPFWFGNVELIIDSPSLGLDEVEVGIVPLTGLPTRQFVDLDFELPPDVVAALSTDFDDLVLRLGLNVPTDATGTYLFDNLRFGGASACDFDCDGGTCVDGICQIPCPPDFGNCDGDPSNGCETSVLADSSNCGGCGVQCGPGTLCQAGVCAASPQCAPHEADCDSDPSNHCEVDTSTDPAHCGGCGLECGQDQACIESLCVEGDIEAELQVTTDWGAGYCANLLLTNQGSVTTTTWKVTLDTHGATLSLWNAEFSGTVGVVTLRPLLWNARIQPDETNTSVGFCASRPGGHAIATILSAVP